MIEVKHYVATLHAAFPGNIAPDAVAQWVNDSTAELVRDLRRLCGPYVDVVSHTITPAAAGGLLVLVNTMVGQCDDDEDDDDDDAPASGPDPAPSPPARKRLHREVNRQVNGRAVPARDGWQRHQTEVN